MVCFNLNGEVDHDAAWPLRGMERSIHVKKKPIGYSLVILLCGGINLMGAEMWRDPTVFRINKSEPHAEFTIHESAEAALSTGPN